MPPLHARAPRTRTVRPTDRATPGPTPRPPALRLALGPCDVRGRVVARVFRRPCRGERVPRRHPPTLVTPAAHMERLRRLEGHLLPPNNAAAAAQHQVLKGAVIGLGWMGLLYDLGERVAVDGTYNPNAESVTQPRPRPTPIADLDPHRRFYHHDHPGTSGIPTSYCEALHSHPRTYLAACADPTAERRDLFTTRYPGATAYADAEEMLKAERPDVVAIATNTAGRAELTLLALKYGAKAIFTVRFS